MADDVVKVKVHKPTKPVKIKINNEESVEKLNSIKIRTTTTRILDIADGGEF